MDVISQFVRSGQRSDNTVCPSKFSAFLSEKAPSKNEPEIEARPVSFNCYAIILTHEYKEQRGVHHH